jgi:hypothetical protein
MYFQPSFVAAIVGEEDDGAGEAIGLRDDRIFARDGHYAN